MEYSSPRRSVSPADRGLQTSHRALSRMKDAHHIHLKTQPDYSGPFNPSVAGSPQPESPQFSAGLEHTGVGTGAPVYESHNMGTPRRGVDGLHHSHKGFTQDKAYHDTPIMARPGGYHQRPSTSPIRSRSRSPHEPSVDPPWAGLNTTAPSNFQQPLPPTRYGVREGRIPYALGNYRNPPRGGRDHSAGSPMYSYNGGSGGTISGKPRVDDPVYEWQGGEGYFGDSYRRPREPHHHHHHHHPSPTNPVVTSVQTLAHRPPSPPLQNLITTPSKPPKDFYVYNLSGNWVSRPGGEEVIRVTHTQPADTLAGVSTRAAEWSEVRVGEAVEGRVRSENRVPQVELSRQGTPILRLYPEMQPDGRLLLLPSPGTVGNSGYWEIMPSSVNGGITPLHDPQSSLEVTYEVDNAELDKDGNTVINIFA